MGHKQRSVLFLVHIEEAFRSHFPMQVPENFGVYPLGHAWLQRLIRACKSHDLVIALESQVDTNFELVDELRPHVNETWNWSWGYEAKLVYDYDLCDCDAGPDYDSVHDYGFRHTCKAAEWVIESDGHEATWVPVEIREPKWRNYYITVAGGCRGECLSDWLSVLQHMNLRYKMPESYVYG